MPTRGRMEKVPVTRSRLAICLAVVVLLVGTVGLLGSTSARFTSAAVNPGTYGAAADFSLGALHRWGINNTPAFSPQQVGTATNWANASGGLTTACGLRTDNTMYCWGGGNTNANGLGDGWTGVFGPSEVVPGTTWKQAVSGYDYACAIKATDNTLWCWGDNPAGNMGDGTTGNAYSVPTQVSTASWSQVAVGRYHTCGIKTDGSLWCWGLNTSGQIGNNSLTNSSVPVAIAAGSTWVNVDVDWTHTCAVRNDHTLWCWGAAGSGAATEVHVPTQVGALTTWASVQVSDSTCALRTDTTTLWCWGLNSSGQLGIGSTTNQTAPQQVTYPSTTGWTSVSVYARNACATRTGGTVWCWGTNQVGANGQGTAASTLTTSPVQVGSYTNWSSVNVGSDMACGVRTPGTLWCWGTNRDGQIGLSQPSSVLIDATKTWKTVARARMYGCATRAGTLLCVDNNERAQAGIGNYLNQQSFVQPSGTGGSTWIAVTGAFEFTCAITNLGKLYCWGQNYWGMVGNGTTTDTNTPVAIDTSNTYQALTSGNGFACGLRTDYSLWCWGHDNNGQVGNGGTADVTSPTRVGTGYYTAVSAGANHACAIERTTAVMYCWGANNFGQQGQGDTATHSNPAAVTGYTWKTLAAGGWQTCGIASDGSLYCWGRNTYGQLGIGSTTSQTTPQRVGTGTNWATVTSGWLHVCAAQNDRTVYCWGQNSLGQLGLGDYTTRTTPTLVPGILTKNIVAGWYGTYAVY